MAIQKTWPGGATDTSPSSWSIPEAGDYNWSSLTGFLAALGDSAQSTTFQKFGIRVATSTPVDVSTTDFCVSVEIPSASSVVLPPGESKLAILISDGSNNASVNNIVITPQPGQTIGGTASWTLNGNRDSVLLLFEANSLDWKIVIWTHH